MRRTPWRTVSFLLVLGPALISCEGPNRGTTSQPSSPSGFHVTVAASPNTVRGATAGSGLDTGGCSQIVVKVFDTNGSLVDGAPVIGTATLGVFRVGTQDFLNFAGNTQNGVLSRTWCSKAERGTATVTVTAEDAVATVLITIS